MKIPLSFTRRAVAGFAAAAAAVSGVAVGAVVNAGTTTTNTGFLWSATDANGRPFIVDLRDVSAVFPGDAPFVDPGTSTPTPDQRYLVNLVLKVQNSEWSVVQFNAGSNDAAAAIITFLRDKLGVENKPVVIVLPSTTTTVPATTTTRPPSPPSSS